MTSVFDPALGLDGSTLFHDDHHHAPDVDHDDQSDHNATMSTRQKCVVLDTYRAEIEARTLAGETCVQIAQALAAKGFDTHPSSVARKRLRWGLRHRAQRTFKAPLNRRAPSPGHGDASDRERTPEYAGLTPFAKDSRRAEITRLTEQGKTAEEIADILTARGAVFKKGASTVWRLQTFWKIVPYDGDRARRRGKGRTLSAQESSAGRAAREAEKAAWDALTDEEREARLREKRRLANERKAEKKREEKERAEAERGRVTHYPTNCAFGPPQKRHVPRASPSLDQQPQGLPNTQSPTIGAGEAAEDVHNQDDEPIQIDTDPSSSEDESDYGDATMQWHGGDESTPPTSMEADAASYPAPSSRQPQQPIQPQHHRQVFSTDRAQHHQHPTTPPPLTASSDVMSAQIIADLASSTVTAAHDLKALTLAFQTGRSTSGSSSALPPTSQEVSAAKRKVWEAARSVMELAQDH
ncbi:hypothetical protein B0A50_01567 [Salinomyces thailandicus]|uniref:Uncharacterized protein n=1 Tax=Salinomyces thailandicus TaxID=706561 RepID=A0A4V5N843_9PEZI|nr:hypothetical protein B0A50_01567 [Salinomyces thailandica]